MHDEPIDVLLSETIGGDAPELSADFDRRVLRGVRARRWTTATRVGIGVYVVAASVVAWWLLRDVGLLRIEQALAATAVMVIAVTIYGRRLVEAC